MLLAQAFRGEREEPLARHGRRRHGRDDVRGPLPGQRAGARHRADTVGYPARFRCRIVEGQRHLEAIPGRGKAGRVRLHDQFRRDFALCFGRAGRRGRPGDRRHAHFAGEFRQLERRPPGPVRQRDPRIPEGERLEPPRGHGTHPAQHFRAKPAAGLHAGVPDFAGDRQDLIEQIVERQLRFAQFPEPPGRIRRLPVRQKVDALVHERNRRDQPRRRSGCGRDVHHDLAFARWRHTDGRRHPDRQFVFRRPHGERHLAVGARRQMPHVRLHALHHRKRDMHVRRPGGFRPRQNDFACRVREFQNLDMEHFLALDRQESPPRKGCADRQARHVSRTVVRLVRRERHLGRTSQRRADGLIPPIAEVESAAEGDVRLPVGYRQRIVGAIHDRERQIRRALRIRLERKFRDFCRHARRFPFPRPGRVHLVGVHRIHAADAGGKLAHPRKRLPVRPDADDGDPRLSRHGFFQPGRKRRAYIIRIIVEKFRRARRRRASTILENGSLHRHAHAGLGETQRRPKRRPESVLALFVEDGRPQAAETRLETPVLVPERVRLPSRRRERGVFENEGAFRLQTPRRTAEQVLGGDGKGEVRQLRTLRQGGPDPDLRRRELLHLDRLCAQLASVLPRRAHDNPPLSARLVGGNRELVARKRPLRVRQARFRREKATFRTHEREFDRERTRRPALSVAEQGLREDRLVMPVNAALRPHERGTFRRREIVRERALLRRFVHLHRVAERQERTIRPVLFGNDDRERLAFRRKR